MKKIGSLIIGLLALGIGWRILTHFPLHLQRVPSSTTSTEVPASSSTTVQATTAQPAVLSNGGYFGYASIDASTRTIDFDRAYFLTGDDAVRAATRFYACAAPNPTGPCMNGVGDTPDGYFIDNPDPNVIYRFNVASNAKITRVDMGGAGVQEGAKTDLAGLAEHAFMRDSGRNTVLVNIKVANGAVIGIDEVYTP